MLGRLRVGMLRSGGLLGGRVAGEVVVVDKVIRMYQPEDIVAELVEAAVVKVDAQKPYELSAVLDEHRARTQRFPARELTGVVNNVVLGFILFLYDHTQRRIGDRRAYIPPADAAVGDRGDTALLRQDLVQNDLIIRSENAAEKIDQPRILRKQLFRHGFCTSLGLR